MGSFLSPQEIDVPMLEKFTLPASIASEDATYEVSSFIVHSGAERGGGGHYTSCQKIDGQWFLCNDSFTTAIDQGGL
jgi:ubiquitin C-terminal hydrolase